MWNKLLCLIALPSVTCFIPYHSMRLLKSRGPIQWSDMSDDMSGGGEAMEHDSSLGDMTSQSQEESPVFGELPSQPPSTRYGHQPEHRLFVANLNYLVSDEDLGNMFASYGEVVEAFHVNDKFDPSRKRGFGFVTMANMEQCHAAVEGLNGVDMEGRSLVVQVASPEGARRSSMRRDDTGRKVYVGNIDFSTTDDTLHQIFSDYGQVESCIQLREREDPTRKRGFGFIVFSTTESAEAAVRNLNGIEVDGRPLRVNIALQRPPLQRTPPAPYF